jgi:hypothetical protein
MAESLAALTLFNLALNYVGDRSITAPSDSPVCQLYYPLVRDKILSWAPWTFATTRQTLTRIADAPPDDEYSYMYSWPTAPFPLRALSIHTQHFAYAREVYIAPNTPDTQTPVILTSAPSVVLRYIARVSEALFPPLFSDTLAMWLALAISQRLTGKTTLRTQLFAELQTQLGRVIDIDGHQDSPPRALNETYIAIRGEDPFPPMGDIAEPL